MRFLALACLLIVGCGGFGESYTDRALDEFRAGNTYDWRQKRKSPSAKDVAAVEKRVKSVAAGTRRDFYQALRILSNYRDHDDVAFTTLAKSSYPRAAYYRVFGAPDAVNTRDEPNTWSHSCSDGRVTLRGFLKSKAEPDVIMTFPHKPKY